MYAKHSAADCILQSCNCHNPHCILFMTTGGLAGLFGAKHVNSEPWTVLFDHEYAANEGPL